MKQRLQQINTVRKLQAKQRTKEAKQRLESQNKLIEAVERLHKLISGRDEFDPAELTKQMYLIADSIDIKDELSQLKVAVESIKPKDIKIPEPKDVDFTKLIEAVKANKPVNVDLAKLEKAIISVEQRIREASIESQAPTDYQPSRRVIKVGNRLVFDDQGTPPRSGGGGGTPSITVDGINAVPVANPDGTTISSGGGGDATAANQVTGNSSLSNIDTRTGSVTEAVPATDTASSGLNGRLQRIAQRLTSVIALLPGSLGQKARTDSLAVTLSTEDVSTLTPPAAITGFATAAKQDTAQTALDAIKTASETLDNAVAGSEMQVDVVGALPVGNNNIGDVDVASSALPSGASTSAKQDTQQTALDAIKTAIELLDNVVSGSEAQVDVVGSLPAGTNAIGKLAANSGVDIGDVDVLTMPQPAPPTALVAFLTTVTTAGTRVQLASNAVNAGILEAPSTNTGLIYVGGSLVSASVYGAELQPGQSTGIAIDNTNKMYIDSSVSGEKCAFLGS